MNLSPGEGRPLAAAGLEMHGFVDDSLTGRRVTSRERHVVLIEIRYMSLQSLVSRRPEIDAGFVHLGYRASDIVDNID